MDELNDPFLQLQEEAMAQGRKKVLLRIIKIKLQKGKSKEEIIEALDITDEEYLELIKEVEQDEAE